MRAVMRRFSLPDRPFFDLLALGVLLALLFGIGLGDRLYSAPSESRYVEIGREMAESGDFVTPRLDYVKYFEKPPLFYWIQAESTRLLGFDTFAARIPTLLFAVALGLLTYCLARMLYGRRAAWLATFCIATSLYLFALSRIVLVDLPVSVFLVATLTCFLYAAHAPDTPKRTLVTYGMYAAAACAVLTKGLIGAVLPGAVIFLWLAATGRWALLGRMRLITGTLLFLLIAVPWHVLVAERNPEFLHFYFIHEHFERYLTKVHGRYQPAWFFIPVLLAGLFPWTVFIWQAKMDALRGFWRIRRQDGRPLFLILWIGFIFLFFSLSDSKLIPYILPIFPPLAALIGRYFDRVWRHEHLPGFIAGLITLFFLLILIAALPSLLLGTLDKDSKVILALSQGGDELQYLSIAAMIAAGILLLVYIQGRRRHVVIAMFALMPIILQLGDQVASHYNKDSMANLSEYIVSGHQPGDEVAMYQDYYQDLPIYLKRRITIADWKGELEFGTRHEDTSAWMLDDTAFWARWMKGDHLIWVIMREDAYNRLTKDKTAESLHLYYIIKDGRNFLFINKPPESLPKPQDNKPQDKKP